jgi:hypothetical protein
VADCRALDVERRQDGEVGTRRRLVWRGGSGSLVHLLTHAWRIRSGNARDDASAQVHELRQLSNEGVGRRPGLQAGFFLFVAAAREEVAVRRDPKHRS